MKREGERRGEGVKVTTAAQVEPRARRKLTTTAVGTKGDNNFSGKPPQDEENAEDSQIDALLGEAETDSTAVATVNPLFDLIKGQGYQGGPVIASFELKDKETVLN